MAFGLKRVHVRDHERGIVCRDGEYVGLLRRGRSLRFDLFGRTRVTVLDRRAPWLPCEGLDLLVRSGVLGDEAEVLDLDDHHRALVWLDSRYAGVLGPGLHAWWKGMVDVRCEVVDIRDNGGALRHVEAATILSHGDAHRHFDIVVVQQERRGALYRCGEFAGLLAPGSHGYWRGAGVFVCVQEDMREQVLDIAGQDVLTADKLTVRLNAVLSYRVADVEKGLAASADVRQSLYREAQLLLRAQVGGLDLDALMAGKDVLASDMEKAIRGKAAAYGLTVVSFGVRDVILPGDIRELLLKATEARKASEAATIVRREETAAMRHQLNTARMLAENPALMRLREFETLEKVAAGSKLKIILGESGLAEKMTAMI